MVVMKVKTFLSFIQRSIKARPIITNTTIYFTFYSAAEVSQQTYERFFTPKHTPFDVRAGTRIAAVYSCLYAPTLYFWYRHLDAKYPGTGVRQVATKVLKDQFMMTPILMATFYIVLGILEGKEEVLYELKAKYWRTFLANQYFWIPGQTINFFLVPPHLRVAYVATLSFVWINCLCFIKRSKSA